MLAELKGWGWLIVLLLNGFVFWAGWSLTKKFVTREDYEADSAKLQEKQSELAREQKSMGTLPTDKDMHNISLSLSEMRGDMKALNEKMDGQAALQKRMENNLNLLMRGHMRSDA